MDNPFSWDYLTAPLSEVDTFGPFSIGYLVVFGLVFLISAYLNMTAPKRFAHHRLHRQLVRRATQILIWVTGIGLLLFSFRALRFPFLTLELRIWLYLALLVFLGVIAYFAYYYRTIYPTRLAAFEKERVRRQYLPAAGSRRSRRRAQRSEQAPRTRVAR